MAEAIFLFVLQRDSGSPLVKTALEDNKIVSYVIGVTSSWIKEIEPHSARFVKINWEAIKLIESMMKALQLIEGSKSNDQESLACEADVISASASASKTGPTKPSHRKREKEAKNRS